MNLLAIDTATEKFSLAISEGSNTWFFQADAGLRHSELLMEGIDLLMKKAALKPADLEGIVCSGGPGSFTGLRIGFSTAKGLALPLDIPFVSVPTLDCIARPFASLPQLIVPVIDAKQNAFFCAMYHNGIKIHPDMDAKAAEIALTLNEALLQQGLSDIQGRVLLTGPGAQLLCEKLSLEKDFNFNCIINGKELIWGNALSLLTIAKEKKYFSGEQTEIPSGPQYIRKSDAEIKGGGEVRS